MNYRIADIEDQILATLRSDATLAKMGVQIETHAGEVTMMSLLRDPAMMEGYIKKLPFILTQYVGFRPVLQPQTHRTYVHEVYFRLYTGAESLRTKREAQIDAYTMLGLIYDGLHGKVLKSTPQVLAGLEEIVGTLDGDAITDTTLNPFTGLREEASLNNRLVLNLPTIVIYDTLFYMRIQA